MPKPLARWLVALAGAALLGGLLPSAATATRPSTQAEIDGILAAVQRSPLLAKIPGRPFIVTQITVSTASTSPLYASGVVSPRKVAGRRRPAIDLLFRQNADGTWALLDFGDNFCGDAQVPGPVLQDLFGTSCGGSGGGSQPGVGYRVLGTAVAGPSTIEAHCRAWRASRWGPAGQRFLEVAVNRKVVVQQTVGRVLGFNWNLLDRPGGGGVIALAAVGQGPQYFTARAQERAGLRHPVVQLRVGRPAARAGDAAGLQLIGGAPRAAPSRPRARAPLADIAAGTVRTISGSAAAPWQSRPMRRIGTAGHWVSADARAGRRRVPAS